LPDQNAENVQISFIDYIKNVASSEVYPTWPESAIRANIYAQISYALNRVYTQYYRARGYDFDITNTTQYDQAFVAGREVFENISRIVDDIFDSYIVKGNSIVPFFAQYCNGTTSTCSGLSQWGTVDLARRGYVPYDILTYYYGPDINIRTNVPVQNRRDSFPGYILSLGASGNSVRNVQMMLNRIRRNYPAIERIPEENGVFDTTTQSAVREFQKIFSLPQTGSVDKATWYQMVAIFNAVTRLNDLAAEIITIDQIRPIYAPVLRLGVQGNEVRIIQYYLAVLNYFNPNIPPVTIDGIYGPETQAAVIAFQQEYGLTPDGIIGPRTWEKLSSIYRELLPTLSPETLGNRAAPYPGYVLSPGMDNADVANLQRYLSTIAQAYDWALDVPVTGYFGDRTLAAVRRVQQQFGLEPISGVGPIAWNTIANLYNEIIERQ